MSMPFDATLKDLGRDAPADFLTVFDQPPSGPVALLNVDLSTITTAADLVIGIGDPLAEVIHIDFQSSAAAWKHADILAYNALIFAEYRVPVHSIVILLRPQAGHANLNGVVNYAARSGRGRMDFAYELIPLWQRPAAGLLAGALGTTPLAMLGALPEGVPLVDALGVVAQQLIERLEREAPPEQARKLLTAAFLLTGLRVRREVAQQVFRGVRAMRDSDTYMMIIDEGREQEAKSLILIMGRKRFGPPDESITTRLNAVTDLDRLHRLAERMFDTTSWQDLLDTP
jgi:hypothetical protein